MALRKNINSTGFALHTFTTHLLFLIQLLTELQLVALSNLLRLCILIACILPDYNYIPLSAIVSCILSVHTTLLSVPSCPVFCQFILHFSQCHPVLCSASSYYISLSAILSCVLPVHTTFLSVPFCPLFCQFILHSSQCHPVLYSACSYYTPFRAILSSILPVHATILSVPSCPAFCQFILHKYMTTLGYHD